MSARVAGIILLAILLFVPFAVRSEFWLSFWLLVLMFAFLGQSWNVLGGYGGQFSFGHALFFGTGAYLQAIAQIQWAMNPWLARELRATTPITNTNPATTAMGRAMPRSWERSRRWRSHLRRR